MIKSFSAGEQDAARERALASTHADSDRVIANRLADYFLSFGLPYSVMVLLAKRGDPCPLPHTRVHKNSVCFTTEDANAARDWIVLAALQGYCVLHAKWGCGLGTIAAIRERSAS
jgi:hypothetical protein